MELDRILLVDDSQPFNFLTRMVLNQNGVKCRIDEALTGKAAIDYINKNTECPDVILLDINMPVMDGFEFLEEFEKRSKCHKITRIFMLTSSDREEDKAMALGNPRFKGYFDKPLKQEHIKKILESFNS